MLGLLVRLAKTTVKAGVFIGAIAVVIAYARLSDIGDLRKDLIDQIENSFAGRLSIEGDVELQLSYPPRITIEDVRVRNARWGFKARYVEHATS